MGATIGLPASINALLLRHHDLVKFLLVLARLGRYLLLLHAFDLALDAVEVNEAFQ